jgi:hypothetical protein
MLQTSKDFVKELTINSSKNLVIGVMSNALTVCFIYNLLAGGGNDINDLALVDLLSRGKVDLTFGRLDGIF